MLTIVAIMAIQKKKEMNPSGRNCCNYDNFQTRMIVHGYSNCCNYDHSENNIVDS